MTTTILIIANVFSALAIIGLTLMQQSKGDMGSAFGGGSSQSMFGSRGSANFLSRATSMMCVVFFATSLALAYVYAQRAESSSVISDTETAAEQTVEISTNESVPSIPDIENPQSNDAVEQEVPSVPEAVIENLEEQVPEVPAVPE